MNVWNFHPANQDGNKLMQDVYEQLVSKLNISRRTRNTNGIEWLAMVNKNIEDIEALLIDIGSRLSKDWSDLLDRTCRELCAKKREGYERAGIVSCTFGGIDDILKLLKDRLVQFTSKPVEFVKIHSFEVNPGRIAEFLKRSKDEQVYRIVTIEKVETRSQLFMHGVFKLIEYYKADVPVLLLTSGELDNVGVIGSVRTQRRLFAINLNLDAPDELFDQMLSALVEPIRLPQLSGDLIQRLRYGYFGSENSMDYVRNGLRYSLLHHTFINPYWKEMDASIFKDCCFIYWIVLGKLRDSLNCNIYRLHEAIQLSAFFNGGIDGNSWEMSLTFMKFKTDGSLHMIRDLAGDLLLAMKGCANVDKFPYLRESLDRLAELYDLADEYNNSEYQVVSSIGPLSVEKLRRYKDLMKNRVMKLPLWLLEDLKVRMENCLKCVLKPFKDFPSSENLVVLADPLVVTFGSEAKYNSRTFNPINLSMIAVSFKTLSYRSHKRTIAVKEWFEHVKKMRPFSNKDKFTESVQFLEHIGVVAKTTNNNQVYLVLSPPLL